MDANMSERKARWAAAIILVGVSLGAIRIALGTLYSLIVFGCSEGRMAHDVTKTVYSGALALTCLLILQFVYKANPTPQSSREPRRPKHLVLDIFFAFVFVSLIFGFGGALNQVLNVVENKAAWQTLLESDDFSSFIVSAAVPVPAVLAISYWLMYREWRKKPSQRNYRHLIYPLIAVNFVLAFIIRMNLTYPSLLTGNSVNDGLSIPLLLQAENIATGFILFTAGLTSIGLLFMCLSSLRDHWGGPVNT